MKQTDIKYFSGLLNSDDVHEFLGKGDYMNAVNILMSPGQDGQGGIMRKRRSTVEISNTLPSGDNMCVGGCVDEGEGILLFFNKNSNGNHGIYAFLSSDRSIKKVLMQSDSVASIIEDSGIQCVVDHGQLYWTTGSGEPMRINYKAGLKSYTPSYAYDWAYDISSKIPSEVLYVIRNPMNLPVSVEKKNNGSYVGNFIADQSVMFFTRYSFVDGEVSVLSPGSKLMNYNDINSIDNYIKVTLPQEIINQDVQLIELVVRFVNTNKFYVIKTWDKDVDGALILAHNSGTLLTFDYYGDITGYPISGIKPFDSIPRDVKTMEISKSRLWMGNYKEGYDTPKKTSLSTSIVEVEDGGVMAASWYVLRIDVLDSSSRDIIDHIEVWVASVAGANPKYYYFDSIVYRSIPPSTITLSSATASSNIIGTIVDFVIGFPPSPSRYTFTFDGRSSVVVGATGSITDGMNIFKSNSSVQLGVVFGGVGRRRSGVITNSSNKVTTPARSYTQTVYNKGMAWSLSNADAVNEIPEWATHYWIVRTLNLTTRFFLQCRAKKITYVNKENNNTFSYTDTYATTNYGLAFDISALPSYGMGYLYNDGDLVTFYPQVGDPVTLRIIGQEGPYIHCTLLNLGNTASVKGLLDIFTPYKKTENEIFYAIGECFKVSGAGTPAREYSVTGGEIDGDVSLILRDPSTPTGHFVEAMSPNDKFWTEWNTDCYEPNVITKLGEVLKENHFRHSAKHLYGTQNNGMSSFDALDEDNVPVESGGITVLKRVSKTQEDGSVILAIGRFRTSSIYVGESQLLSANSTAFIAKSDGVIGTVNPLQGDFGTVHPESVSMFNGGVFWYDDFKGAIVQYSQSGLFPVSEYKVSSSFYKMSRDGNTSIWPGGVDLENKDYIITKKSSGAQYARESYSLISGRSDKDMAKPEDASCTMSYRIGGDKWTGSWQFIPERYISLGLELFVFNGGKMYSFSGSDYNNFFGVQRESILCFTSNEGPDEKEYRAISVFADDAPDVMYVKTERPNQQVTTAIKSDFYKLNGVFSSPVYCDMTSPNVDGSPEQKMYSGDIMVSPAMKFQLHFSGNKDLRLKFVEVAYYNSLGTTKRQ